MNKSRITVFEIFLANVEIEQDYITWRPGHPQDSVKAEKTINKLKSRLERENLGPAELSIRYQVLENEVQLILLAAHPSTGEDLGGDHDFEMTIVTLRAACEVLVQVLNSEDIPPAQISISAGEPARSTDRVLLRPEPIAAIANLLRKNLPSQGVSIRAGDKSPRLTLKSKKTHNVRYASGEDSSITYISSPIYCVNDLNNTAKLEFFYENTKSTIEASFAETQRATLLNAQLAGKLLNLSLRATHILSDEAKRVSSYIIESITEHEQGSLL